MRNVPRSDTRYLSYRRTALYVTNHLLQQRLTIISSKQSDHSNSNFKQKTLNSLCYWTKIYIGVHRILRTFRRKYVHRSECMNQPRRNRFVSPSDVHDTRRSIHNWACFQTTPFWWRSLGRRYLERCLLYKVFTLLFKFYRPIEYDSVSWDYTSKQNTFPIRERIWTDKPVFQ